MQLYKCLSEDKVITEKAIKKGICAGHSLVEWNDPKKDIVKKVFISIPTEGHTLPEAYDNHLTLMMRLGGLQERWRYEKRPIRYEFYFYTTGRLLTQMAREKLMQVAILGKADYVVMFDDDMLLELDSIEKMLSRFEQNPEIDVLAALAFMRNPPHYPVLYVVEEGYDPIRRTDYYINRIQPDFPKDALVEADAVGFGYVMIKMEMVKKMKAPYFMSTTATGEDIMFCVNARTQAKARIFMDTGIKTGHIGNPVIIDDEYFKKFQKEHKKSKGKPINKYAIDEYDVTKLNDLDR